MKPAEGVLKELVLHVRPPRGRAIVLTEWNSSGPTDPNWVAAWERRSSSAIVIKSPICVKQTQKSTGLTSRLLLVSTGWLFGFRRSIAATRRVRSQARRGECSTRSAPNTCPVEGAALQDGKTAEPIVCPLVRVELARLPVDMFVVGGDAPIRAAMQTSDKIQIVSGLKSGRLRARETSRLPLPRQPAWLSAAIIGHLAARNSDDREGVRQKTPGSKIVKRRHEETVGEISRSAENETKQRGSGPRTSASGPASRRRH
jgi:hypothetical protein